MYTKGYSMFGSILGSPYLRELSRKLCPLQGSRALLEGSEGLHRYVDGHFKPFEYLIIPILDLLAKSPDPKPHISLYIATYA